MRRSLIALSITLAACGPSGSKKYLQKGDIYLAQAKYADASIQYRKALQSDPELAAAYYHLGIAELKQKHYSVARTALERAVTLQPGGEDAARELAQLCLTSYLGDLRRPKDLYEEIKSLSDRMIARDDRSFEGLRLRGYLAMADSKAPEAIGYFRQANLVKPLQPDVVTALVQNLIAEKQYAEAETTGLDLIERQKTSAPIYAVLYFHYVALGKPEKAEAILRRKIANNPGQAAYVVELCRNLWQRRKTDASAACLQELAAGSPEGPLIAADFYGEMGDWPEALRRYQEAEREHLSDATIYRRRIIAALLKQNKREEAGQALDAFLRDHPHDIEAGVARALLLVESRTPENVDRGTAVFKSLVAANPGSWELREKLGTALAAQVNLPAAQAEFLEALKLNPVSLASLIGLAEISVRTERFQEGLGYTAAILSHDPQNVAARLLRTACLTGANQLIAARHELFGLIADNPANQQAQLQLALLDVMEKHYAEAEQRFRAHYKPGDGDFRALQGIVQIYAARGQFPQAIVWLQEELKKRPASPEIQGLLADTAMRGRQYELAITSYKVLAERNPRSALVLLNLGNAYIAVGNYPAAILALQKAGGLQPNNREIVAVMGPALEAAGRVPEAKAVYRRYLKTQPQDSVVLNNLAFLMADTNENLDQAQQFSEEALRGSPTHPDFLDTLALVHLKKNNTGVALQILTNLTGKYAENPAFRYHLGLVWLKSGSRDKAYADFRTALALGLPPKEAGEAKNLMRN